MNIYVIDKKSCPLHVCPDCGRITHPAEAFLTMRELEVLRLIGQGIGRKAICHKLFFSPGTYDAHIANICLKFGIERGQESTNTAVLLAHEAIKLGLN